MSTSHFPTLMQSPPGGGGATTTTTVINGAQLAALTAGPGGGAAAAVPGGHRLILNGLPVSGSGMVKTVIQLPSQPGQPQHQIQYRIQPQHHQVPLSPPPPPTVQQVLDQGDQLYQHQIVHQRHQSGGHQPNGPIYIETTSGSPATIHPANHIKQQQHQLLQQQQHHSHPAVITPVASSSSSSSSVANSTSPPPPPGGLSLSNGTTLLTEIKTEPPSAFSPSSPSSVPSPPSHHHQHVLIQQHHPQPQQQPHSPPEWKPLQQKQILQQQQQQQQQLQQPQSPQDWKHPIQQQPQQQQLQQQQQQQQNQLNNKKSNKGPTPRPQEELCLVCADRASGYHYNALACEGCKGFFRRSITRNASYACKYGGACEIDMYMRRKCQACRLKKCYTVGMKAECVIPENQCKAKKEQKEKKKQQQEDLKRGAAAAGAPSSDPKRAKICQNGMGEDGGYSTAAATHPHPIMRHYLQPEEEELINRLVFFQKEYEDPSEQDLSKVYHVPMQGSAVSESEQLFRHMTEMTILTVQLIVDFSKHLPGFRNICRDDQVMLLKGCSSEVMMLRGARKYDPVTDSIVFATNHPFTKENYVKAGLGNEELFRFCRRMTNMKVDNAEFALVTAIDIFSYRQGLQEPKRVEKIREIYVEALHSYVMANRKSEPTVMFCKLLSVLTELRSLGYNNSRMCIELRMEKNKKLPDFLEEIWDLR